MVFAVFRCATFPTSGGTLYRLSSSLSREKTFRSLPAWSVPSSKRTDGVRGTHWRGRHGPRFSTTMASLSSSPLFSRDENERPAHHRSYHTTNRNEIVLPFLPEMIAFVFVAGGWTAYRTYHGKPLTPDEALQAQEAYRQHQERLRQQRESRRKQMEFKRQVQ